MANVVTFPRTIILDSVTLRRLWHQATAQARQSHDGGGAGWLVQNNFIVDMSSLRKVVVKYPKILSNIKRLDYHISCQSTSLLQP